MIRDIWLFKNSCICDASGFYSEQMSCIIMYMVAHFEINTVYKESLTITIKIFYNELQCYQIGFLFICNLSFSVSFSISIFKAILNKVKNENFN